MTFRKFHDVDPSADPQDALTDAARGLAELGFFRHIQPTPRFPLTSERMAEILNHYCDFDVDAEGLEDLVDRGLIERPGRGQAGLEWSPLDLREAYAVLCYRKQYKPTPSRSDVLKNFMQRHLEQARRAGNLASLAEAFEEKLDVRHCLAALVDEQSPAVRDKMASVLLFVLEYEHGIRI